MSAESALFSIWTKPSSIVASRQVSIPYLQYPPSHPPQAVQQADFIVPVEIEYHWHHFHVLKRPGVDNFLKQMGDIYEVVIFTASLSKVCLPYLPLNFLSTFPPVRRSRSR